MIGCYLVVSISSYAQVTPGYYLFPIQPGQQNFLAGNMAEIRPNHFHSGIDIKTGGRQGLPVYAAADGYVHRMKISTYGYGNILFLKHPNGQYTVYAHLKDFAPKIAEYMWGKMVEAQQNSLEHYPDSTALPVKKGDVIAYSGNTGSSGGPHLHFEIRDSLDRAIDPLKFGFSEIKDNTPPTITGLAITPLEHNSRINGKFERTVFPIQFRGNHYVVNGDINITGKVGIEIRGYDKLDGAYNPNGFPKFEIFEGPRKTFEVNVDKVDFNIGRFLLSHTHQNQYTKLYRTSQNLFDYYSPDTLFSGAITVAPDSTKEVTVKVEDVYSNHNLLKLNFQGQADRFEVNGASSGRQQKIEYRDNWLIIRVPKSEQGHLALFHVNGFMMDVATSYQNAHHRTYIWDMQFGIPDSVDVCTEVIYPEVKARIPFQEEIFFTDGTTEIQFDKNDLLSDLFLRISPGEYQGNPALEVNDRTTYLWDSIAIKMDARGFSKDKSRTHVYELYPNGRKNFLGGTWEGDHITFKTKKFGTFVLASDLSPPIIRPIQVNPNQLRFYIRDDISGIKDFEAYVDDQWILMRYESKQGVIWSEKLDKAPFKGALKLRVTDNAGNTATFNRNL